MHALHPVLARQYMRSFTSPPEPLQSFVDDQSMVIDPDLLHSLHSPSESEDCDDTRDSDFESQSGNELPSSVGEESRMEYFESAGKTFGKVRKGYDNAKESAQLLAAPWDPVHNATEFKIARFFLESGTSQQVIDIFFKGSLAPTEVSFGSAYTLRTLLDSMNTPLGPESWNRAEVVMARGKILFY